MPKNLVVCCDGTANEFGDRNSNVVKIYSVLERNTPDQIAFYDPGVGTFSPNPAVTAMGKFFWRVLGLGFGFGITQNVLDAYTFIMQNYRQGDKIYLFGFSRGAYTARVLAGLIHKCGQLGRDNHNLLPYAMRIFKPFGNQEIAEGFKATFGQPCPIHFLGLWDTVSTVGWVWNATKFPHVSNNPDVAHVRHAIAIDERRAFYRQNLWRGAGDVKQVWFPGVHSDVGGSYPEGGLGKLALEWMIVEAMSRGLLVDLEKARDLVYSEPLPNPSAMLHNSLKWYWWPTEFWPKVISFRKSNGEWGRKPHFNLGRRRRIDPDYWFHQSVVDRLNDPKAAYRPRNLPEELKNVEPRVRLEDPALNENVAGG